MHDKFLRFAPEQSKDFATVRSESFWMEDIIFDRAECSVFLKKLCSEQANQIIYERITFLKKRYDRTTSTLAIGGDTYQKVWNGFAPSPVKMYLNGFKYSAGDCSNYIYEFVEKYQEVCLNSNLLEEIDVLQIISDFLDDYFGKTSVIIGKDPRPEISRQNTLEYVEGEPSFVTELKGKIGTTSERSFLAQNILAFLGVNSYLCGCKMTLKLDRLSIENYRYYDITYQRFPSYAVEYDEMDENSIQIITDHWINVLVGNAYSFVVDFAMFDWITPEDILMALYRPLNINLYNFLYNGESFKTCTYKVVHAKKVPRDFMIIEKDGKTEVYIERPRKKDPGEWQKYVTNEISYSIYASDGGIDYE